VQGARGGVDDEFDGVVAVRERDDVPEAVEVHAELHGGRVVRVEGVRVEVEVDHADGGGVDRGDGDAVRGDVDDALVDDDAGGVEDGRERARRGDRREARVVGGVGVAGGGGGVRVGVLCVRFVVGRGWRRWWRHVRARGRVARGASDKPAAGRVTHVVRDSARATTVGRALASLPGWAGARRVRSVAVVSVSRCGDDDPFREEREPTDKDYLAEAIRTAGYNRYRMIYLLCA
jgi:hypothetical protein